MGSDCSAVVNYKGHYLPSSGENGLLHFISLSNWVIVLPGCTETANEYQCKWKRRKLACWSNCVVLNCVYDRCLLVHCVAFPHNPPTNWMHNWGCLTINRLHCGQCLFLKNPTFEFQQEQWLFHPLWARAPFSPVVAMTAHSFLHLLLCGSALCKHAAKDILKRPK